VIDNLKKKEENGDKQYKRIERLYGSFTRRFAVPKNTDLTKISAQFENGILKIVIPKQQEQESEEGTEIKITGV